MRIKNGLVVGVILLFIGVGAYPTIAINLRDYSSSEMSEKDNSIPISQEEYENSNCIVIGRTTRTLKLISSIFSKSICFGIRDVREGAEMPSQGWIYTKSLRYGEWLYEGEFWGKLGNIQLPNTMVHYIAIRNFHGFILGGSFFYFSIFNSYFIGYAKEVKITTNRPWII